MEGEIVQVIDLAIPQLKELLVSAYLTAFSDPFIVLSGDDITMEIPIKTV